MKKFIKDRKGTAEVIGTLMAIIILLFFFTNVYLWHDAATKDANQVYLEKINSTFKIEQVTGTDTLEVTASGGSDIALSRLWIDDDTTNMHYYAELNNVPITAGTSFNITFDMKANAFPTQSNIAATPQKGGVLIEYAPGLSVECTVLNALGVTESTTFTP